MQPAEGEDRMMLRLRDRSGMMSKFGRFGLMWVILLCLGVSMAQEVSGTWRAATEDELKSLLPVRAVVEKEHIQTEMRTASGITDGHGKFVAGVVLITAGYSADGKYSHYLMVRTRCESERCCCCLATTSSGGSAKRMRCMFIFTMPIRE